MPSIKQCFFLYTLIPLHTQTLEASTQLSRINSIDSWPEIYVDIKDYNVILEKVWENMQQLPKAET